MHGLKTPFRELGSPYREVCRSIKLEGVSHPTSPKKRVSEGCIFDLGKACKHRA